MKKIAKTLLALSLGAFMFVGCVKEDQTSRDISNYPTVKVSGRVVADLDQSTTDLEAVSDVVVTLSVPYSVFFATTNAGDYIVKVKTDADGNYTANIPVSVNGGTAITVKFDEFERLVTYVDNNGLITKQYTKFVSGTDSTTGNPGLESILNFSYAGVGGEEPYVNVNYGDATISGVARIITFKKDSETDKDTTLAPAGTTFKVFVSQNTDIFPSWTEDKVITVTVGENGQYSVKVPSATLEDYPTGTSVDFSGAATTTIQQGTAMVTYISYIKGAANAVETIAPLFANKTKNQNIYFSNPTEINRN